VGVEKSLFTSRLVRHRYRIFQNVRPVAVMAKPVDERKKFGSGSEQSQQARPRGFGLA
jgi:hypothetical protein